MFAFSLLAGIAIVSLVAVISVNQERRKAETARATATQALAETLAERDKTAVANSRTANAEALTFEIRVSGRAAHGSTRLEGVNALDAFLPIYARLQELERERNAVPVPLFLDTALPYPISVGRVSTGDWASSVPDLLIAEGRLGVALGEPITDARAALHNAVAEACASDSWLRDNPAVVTWPGGQFASGRIAEDHPFIAQVSASITDLDDRQLPALSAAPYGSDLRLYSGLGGIPTLHYGPGDVRFAHAPREQVPIAELISVAQSMLVLAARRCGAHF